jgi:hypothetical protein
MAQPLFRQHKAGCAGGKVRAETDRTTEGDDSQGIANETLTVGTPPSPIGAVPRISVHRREAAGQVIGQRHTQLVLGPQGAVRHHALERVGGLRHGLPGAHPKTFQVVGCTAQNEQAGGFAIRRQSRGEHR